MILPTDSDYQAFSRPPWATTALGLVWVLLFAFTQITGQASLREGLRMLETGVRYHRQHPYLALDPRLSAIGGEHPGGDAGAPDRREPAGSLGTQFSTLEQTELDGLTNGGFDALAALPSARCGVVPAKLRPHTLLTHAFVHARWVPLLANLLLLYLLGVYLEARWRRLPLVGLFLLSGAAAGLCFASRIPHYPAPLLGAGGAMAGLAGAFAVEFWNREVHFRYWLGPSAQDNAAVPGLLVLLPWALRELLVLYSPDVLVPEAGQATVTYWAHGGGFAFGAGAAILLRGTGLYRRWVALAEPDRASRPAAGRPSPHGTSFPPGTGAAGDPWETLSRAVRNDPGNGELVQELWTLAMHLGRQREAAPELLRHIQALTRCPHGERAYQLWHELRGQLPEETIPLALEVNLGTCLLEQDLPREAREVLEVAANRAGPTDAPGTLLRLARLLAPPHRANVARLVLGHPEAPAAKRREAQALLSAAPSRQEVGHARAPGEPPPAETAATSPDRFRAVTAIPLNLRHDRVAFELAGADRRSIPLRQIRAIAAAAVFDGGVEPNYVLDLFLDLPRSGNEPVQAVRFTSADYDPRVLFPSETGTEDAFLSLAGSLLSASGAVWLLGANAASVSSYDTPREYQEELVAAARRAGRAR